eukprot:734257-Amphidinium_carterae.1
MRSTPCFATSRAKEYLLRYLGWEPVRLISRAGRPDRKHDQKHLREYLQTLFCCCCPRLSAILKSATCWVVCKFDQLETVVQLGSTYLH